MELGSIVCKKRACGGGNGWVCVRSKFTTTFHVTRVQARLCYGLVGQLLVGSISTWLLWVVLELELSPNGPTKTQKNTSHVRVARSSQ